MFLHRIILILVFILVLIFNPVYLQIGTDMWNAIHIDILISGLLIKLAILISGMLTWLFAGIRPFVLKFLVCPYILNKFRMFICILYLFFCIGFISLFRYWNIGKTIDLKLINYKPILNLLELALFFCDNIYFILLNSGILLFIVLTIISGVKILIGTIYDYISVCFISLHCWLSYHDNDGYYKFVCFVRLKLRNMWFFIVTFFQLFFNRPVIGFKKYLWEIIMWIPKYGIKLFFRFLPLNLFLSSIIYDCVYNNYQIGIWYYITPFLPIYMLLFKLIQYFASSDCTGDVYYASKIFKQYKL